MVRIAYVEIINYKGIKSLRLDFSTDPSRSVHPIIGLNESGKTTILEALTFVSATNEDLSGLNITGLNTPPLHELIPISERTNFTGKISVKLGFALEPADREAIKNNYESRSGYSVSDMPALLTIERTLRFVNAERVENSLIYGLKPKFEKQKPKQKKPLHNEEWMVLRQCIVEHLPSVLYIPNFLFEIPDKIPLVPEGELSNARDAFFHKLLDGLLKSREPESTFQDSIVARATSNSEATQQAFRATIRKLEYALEKGVLDNWAKVGGKSLQGLTTSLETFEDDQGIPMLQISLKHKGEEYRIGERSLGFRWFFAFLMLTFFGRSFGNRKQTVYLLDEPASNLHASAQTKLLKALQSQPNSLFIYSTHSHYLLEADLLPDTFVARNTGYNDDDDYVASMTKIEAIPFRQFVSKHPDQTEHFQVALNVLDVPVSTLEMSYPCVMVEGKSDWYYCRLRQLGGTGVHLKFYPFGGVNSVDARVNQAISDGRDFAVLTDGDTHIVEKLTDRYGELFSRRSVNLADVIGQGATSEDLFSQDDRAKIIAKAGLKGTSKAIFQRAAELVVASGLAIELDPTTISNFSKLEQALGAVLQVTKA